MTSLNTKDSEMGRRGNEREARKNLECSQRADDAAHAADSCVLGFIHELPGIHERVTRPTRIHVQWLDEKMQPHDEWVEGYLARVMQHEFDHLEGKVFVDRISPLRKQLIKSKMRALLQGRVRCGYKTKMAVRK